MPTLRVSVLCVLIVLVVCSLAQALTPPPPGHIFVGRVEEEGRLLVPLRGIFEFFGATVGWAGATRTVTVDRGSDHIVMTVNEEYAQVNGQSVHLDVPPRLHGSLVHVPLRFVGETLGATVDYQGNQVVISAEGMDTLTIHLTSSPGGVGTFNVSP